MFCSWSFPSPCRELGHLLHLSLKGQNVSLICTWGVGELLQPKSSLKYQQLFLKLQWELCCDGLHPSYRGWAIRYNENACLILLFTKLWFQRIHISQQRKVSLENSQSRSNSLLNVIKIPGQLLQCCKSSAQGMVEQCHLSRDLAHGAVASCFLPTLMDISVCLYLKQPKPQWTAVILDAWLVPFFVSCHPGCHGDPLHWTICKLVFGSGQCRAMSSWVSVCCLEHWFTVVCSFGFGDTVTYFHVGSPPPTHTQMKGLSALLYPCHSLVIMARLRE